MFKGYPPASEASRELESLIERENTHTPELCQKMYANLANFRVLLKLLGGYVALDKLKLCQ